MSHKEGPALVLAGPGSGKTTVIAHRIRALIEEAGVRPEHILVITFTRAAADEMKTRFSNLMGGQNLPVTFGTFHSVYFRILKYAYHYDASQIIGDEGRMRFLAEELSDLEPAMAEEPPEGLSEILGEISAVKSDMLDLSHYYAKSCPEQVFRRLFRAYEARLRRENVIDFDDMLSLCYELLTARPDILKGWQGRYRYILCDEFQDINRLQYEILKLLALPENNLFAVGDDDQAIYRFRGARPELMLNFPREFPAAKKYLLSVNYRSTDRIIRAAGVLIAHNRARFEKKITGTRGAGEPVLLGAFSDQGRENRRILEHIREYRRAGCPYEEMAVLSRTNLGLRPLAGMLMEYGIPFTAKDVIPSLYSHQVSRDILAYIKAALGDESRENLLRIINKPCRYISRTALSGKQVSLDEVEAIYEEKPWIGERAARLKADLKVISRRPPCQAVIYIRRAVGYDGWLSGQAKERGLDEKALFDVLEELQADAGEYQTFPEWFAHMERVSEELKKKRRDKSGGVTLSTVHGAKGLEYRAVFLPDVNEGVFPHEKAGIPADLEEERRLFYVAMTRAKDRLHIYWTKERSGRPSEPGRFAMELKGLGPQEGET